MGFPTCASMDRSAFNLRVVGRRTFSADGTSYGDSHPNEARQMADNDEEGLGGRPWDYWYDGWVKRVHGRDGGGIGVAYSFGVYIRTTRMPR